VQHEYHPARQKNWIIPQAPRVGLILDADERVPGPIADEIHALLEKPRFRRAILDFADAIFSGAGKSSMALENRPGV